jgi:peptide-methionine (S)-S-oxide reductase
MKKNILLYVLLAAAIPLWSDEMTPSPDTAPKTETATLAGGCFWCIEAVFEQIPGVIKATSGYTGGRAPNPTYNQVCSGETGHAEAVQVEFDPSKVSFAQILETFWGAHDPTQLNRQGNDVGDQYRSAIFYHSAEQKKIAEESIRQLNASGHYGKPAVTRLEPAGVFYIAEDYHQEYYVNNRSQPYCRAVIRPKLKKLGLKE